jgi:Cys-tRNA(Pro)/Cys-tRNA(Cys) deacylase
MNELDSKKAANAAHEKSIEMIKAKELLPLTGYVHGGCSPIGMKKPFPTFVHQTCADFDTIMFSAGKIGYQVEVAPADLKRVVPYEVADLVV